MEGRIEKNVRFVSYMSDMNFSIIIPVYNRPGELDELLDSLTRQSMPCFEVIVVEDGSELKSDEVVEKYKDQLDITYVMKANSGPGLSRNAGAEVAKNEWLVFFDSDCIIPKDYIKSVSDFLEDNAVDAYGGPDKAHESFTNVQKAINYSMTSFFTTGGIRGGDKKLDKFYPRSFNLGVSKKAFDAIGGYGKLRFGEDIDFSLRLLEAGFSTALIRKAYVYHKRRSTFRQFFKQVYNSGIARINLHLLHPGSMKLVHLLPSLFVIAMVGSICLSFVSLQFLFLPIFYCVLVFVDSLRLNRSFDVAIKSVASTWIQLFGYGIGFLSAVWKRLIMKQGDFRAFEKKFYD